MRRPLVVVSVVVISVFLALVVTGCGGSSSRGAGAGPMGAQRNFGGASSAQFKKFSACLKAHGVSGFGSFRNGNGQRPGAGTRSGPWSRAGNNGGRWPGAGTTTVPRPTLTSPRQTTEQKAFSACRKLLPAGGFGFGRRGGG
ncbi:MAG: hypothetical protein ABSC36_06240 [Gaiellaceae bacterium]